MRHAFWLGIGLLVMAGAAGAAEVKLTAYADPAGVFTLQVPEAWKVTRSDMGGQGWDTSFEAAGEDLEVEIITLASPEELKPGQLGELADKFTSQVIQSLQESGKVSGTPPTADKLAGREAVKRLLVATDPETGVENAVVLVITLGKRNLVAAAVSGPKDKVEALQRGVDLLKTLTIEGGAAVAESIFTQGTLAAAATDIKGNFQARPATTVLAEGTPPLTEGAVRNFADLLEQLYDLRLGDAETEILRQQFIVSYNKSDAAGKQILVASAGDLLKQCLQGTAEQQAASKANLKQVFDQRLAAGAQTGIPWAAALWQAVQRRQQGLATTTAATPAALAKEKVDKEFSQADLDAALEMLYFMWVASGRDAALVTPQAAATVRAALVQNFAAYPADFQYLLCNAESVYARMRNAWGQASAPERAAYAQQFGQALDDLGLTLPRPGGGGGGGGSAWDDVAGMSSGELLAARVQGTAWNLAQKSTGGW